MRQVDRTSVAPPSSLIGSESAGGRELVRARGHFTKDPPPEKGFTFTAYKGDDVRHALEKLFHGKCAYCESRYDIVGPVDIEHFRPKKGVDGDPAHRGYWWLAANWENLLPSCLDCNRRRYQPTPEAFSSLSAVLDAARRTGFTMVKTGKDTCFPVGGTRVAGEPPAAGMANALAGERCVLLDPCQDDPAAHVNYFIDRDVPLGVVFAAAVGGGAQGALPVLSPDTAIVENAARAAGISERGAVSIQVYGLNRLGLVQERTRILRRLEFLADTIVSLAAIADDLAGLAGADAAEKAKIDAAGARIEAQVDRIFAELRDMAAPKAAFSTMVATWLESFEADAADPARASL